MTECLLTIEAGACTMTVNMNPEETEDIGHADANF